VELTVTVTVVVSMGIPAAPVPVTVTLYVPVAVPVVTVNVDVPAVVIDEGLNVAVNPLPVGTVAVSETLPVNPLMRATVIVEVPDEELLMLNDVGEAEIAKFCTFNENAVL